MFTGLVEERGRILKVIEKDKGREFVFSGDTAIKDLKVGDSIAVDGVCLTVAQRNHDWFKIFAMWETLKKTTAGKYKEGDFVNFERPLKLSDRLGGHMVMGHVDGIGEISGEEKQGESLEREFLIPDELVRYTIPKGSIAIDGISLTIAEKNKNRIKIGFIPVTMEKTTQGTKKIGDPVNIEVDMIGKYAENFFKEQDPFESQRLYEQK
ncbi:MAG: riboflavin synthase [bacterium]